MIPELHQNLVSYIGKYTTLKKVAANEYAGPCPVCGGRDRMHVSDKKGFFCRKCTGEKWGDLADFTALTFGWTLKETLRQFNLDRRATPEEIAVMETERKAREAAERQAEQERQAMVHRQLTDCGDWWYYYQNIEKFPVGRELWHKRGLSDPWIEYYRLGYCPSRIYPHDNQQFESASLTMPYFRPVFTQHPEGGADVSWRVVGLQHRLLLPDAPGGKYRPHLAGAGKHLFFTDLHQRNVFGDLLIVEGEIKAMVTWAALWDGETCLFPNTTVIGVPGKGWRGEWLEQFDKADRVWVILDPDAQASAQKLVNRLGDKARNILLPDKIDDLITAGVLDGFKLMEVLEKR